MVSKDSNVNKFKFDEVAFMNAMKDVTKEDIDNRVNPANDLVEKDAFKNNDLIKNDVNNYPSFNGKTPAERLFWKAERDRSLNRFSDFENQKASVVRFIESSVVSVDDKGSRSVDRKTDVGSLAVHQNETVEDVVLSDLQSQIFVMTGMHVDKNVFAEAMYGDHDVDVTPAELAKNGQSLVLSPLSSDEPGVRLRESNGSCLRVFYDMGSGFGRYKDLTMDAYDSFSPGSSGDKASYGMRMLLMKDEDGRSRGDIVYDDPPPSKYFASVSRDLPNKEDPDKDLSGKNDLRRRIPDWDIPGLDELDISDADRDRGREIELF